VLFSLLLIACAEPAPPPPPAEPDVSPVATAPPPHVRSAYLFTRHLDTITDLEIPKSSLAHPLPDSAVAKDWKLMWSEGGVDRYEAPMPYRQSMSGKPPVGVTVTANGKTLPYSLKDDAGTWVEADLNTLALRVPTGAKVPTVRVTCDEAHARELARSLDTSGLEPKEFLVRSERMKKVRRSGLFLPAPATVTFPGVHVAPGSKLSLGMSLVLPVADSKAPSDGAVARVEVGEAGKWTILSKTPLAPGDWKRGTLPLDRWANKTVDFRFTSEAGTVAHADYVFFDEPILFQPETAPERIVVVIIDTLRRDHVGVYGASRPTTPQLDAWAKDALVFDNAHVTAPWTLPSVRTILSGEPPERWETSDTLPERLGAAGYETLAVVSNAYLSRTFRMEEVFSTHIYERRAPAADIVRLAQEQVARLEDRDAFILLHFMDAHLPYQDHEDTRALFAKTMPEGISKLRSREELNDAAAANAPGVRDWLVARYDENIRSIDNALTPFLRALPDALVIVVSDHGEEFWDHGGFEHGHTLYDELMNAVLIVNGPGVTPGRSDAAVSLADVSPTVLDWVGLTAIEGSVGTSFEPALLGERFDRGPLPMGYVLFGEDQWGFLDGGRKLIGGAKGLLSFDRGTDPGEMNPTPADPDAYRIGLEAAWKRPVVDALRVMFGRTDEERPRRIDIHVPGGIVAAWNGIEGPESSFAEPVVTGETATIRANDARMPYEVYVTPTEWTRASEIRIDVDAEKISITGGGEKPGDYYTLSDDAQISVARTIVPILVEGNVKPIDAAANAELRALGYIE
jgi:hypothetical protein